MRTCAPRSAKSPPLPSLCEREAIRATTARGRRGRCHDQPRAFHLAPRLHADHAKRSAVGNEGGRIFRNWKGTTCARGSWNLRNMRQSSRCYRRRSKRCSWLGTMSAAERGSCQSSAGSRRTSRRRLSGSPKARRKARRRGQCRFMAIWSVGYARRRTMGREGCPWVFYHRLGPVGSHLDGWAEACERAGVNGLLFHDLRRSAVRGT
jgi:hypothetical protein